VHFLALSFFFLSVLSIHLLNSVLFIPIYFLLGVFSSPHVPDSMLSSHISFLLMRFLTLSIFFLSVLSSPHFYCFWKDWPFLDMINPQSLMFFSFTSLLSKVPLETFCRKHCKHRATVITQFLGFPQNYHFLVKFKMKQKLETWQKYIKKGFKCIEKPSWSFGKNWEPNCTPLYPRLKRHCRFKVKLNDYSTNLHKN